MTPPRDPRDGDAGTVPDGSRLGHFRVERKLGGGGYGLVYLAEDVDIPGRRVALKLMRGAVADSSAEALRHEASALAALRHPNILVVHEVGSAASGVYLAAEYAPGGTLADRLRTGPLPEAEALAVARAAADALASAHARGVVHRDFKPQNVLFGDDGLVKVADFGLAVRQGRMGPGGPSATGDDATATYDPGPAGHAPAGTPRYMPPEAWSGAGGTAGGDQFAFGLVLHELLTGTRPYPDPKPPDRPRSPAAVDPRLPRDLRRLVARCVALRPEDRFRAMADVVEVLDAAIAKRSPERRRTVRLAVAASIVIALILGGIVAFGAWRTARARSLNEAGGRAIAAGDRASARQAFVAAHAADPDFEPACQNLGTLAMLDAAPDWAVAILRDCAARFPTSPVLLYNLGGTLRATGDLPGAAGALERALAASKRGPTRSLVLNELALVRVAAGEADRAVQLLEGETLPEANTVEGSILRKTLGVALLAAGRPADAVGTLRTALAGSLPAEQRAAARVALGRAAETVGDTETALDAFAKVLLDAGEGETANEARAGLSRLAARTDGR